MKITIAGTGYPSRIVVGDQFEAGQRFANLLKNFQHKVGISKQ